MGRAINVRGSDTEVFDTSDVNSWPLGTRMHVPDGRVFRMAKVGSLDITVGKLVASAAREPQHANLSVEAVRAIGDNLITVTLVDVAVSLGEYNDGLIYVNDGSKQGHFYRITNHLAAAASAVLTLNLHTRLITPMGTSDQVTLIKNVYNGVSVSQALRTERAVGVPPRDVSANQFFWAQTFGPVAILQDGTLFEFRDVSPSKTVHGAVSHTTVPVAAAANDELQATDSIPVLILDAEDNERLADVPILKGLPSTSVVGYSLDPRSDQEYSLVQLTIID